MRAAIAPSQTPTYDGCFSLIHPTIVAVDLPTLLPSCRQNTEGTRFLVLGALKYSKVECIDLAA